MKKITIYTDGSSLGNPGAGGWGAVLLYLDIEKEISGNMPNATNNQMELTAAISAISVIKDECEIEIYTDSQYVKNGITKWIKKWRVNGWKGANKKDVKNRDLWQKLDDLDGKHKINWHWVKAHSGDKYNDKVDEMARNAALLLKN